jgi:ATP-binding cassette subfamily B protein
MEFMETPSKPNGDIKITSTPKIEFKNVSFSYPNSKVKALDDVSFTLEPGQSLAIVGENGAGKTTLIKLLIGAYEPSDGVILINDEPFERIERESYLKQLGALFQEYARYEFATLGENVWFGDVHKKYTSTGVKTALSDADLGNLAAKYEKGLDQILSKDFDNKYTTDLSGGQWQRLSIARAFYRSPNVLLLDEPTAAIDAQAEYRIFQNILARQKDKSTVIISHRFSTVRKAKNIIVLEKGHVIEAGTHDELIAKKGRYHELFNLQAEGYN